jgi:hypothetical protein
MDFVGISACLACKYEFFSADWIDNFDYVFRAAFVANNPNTMRCHRMPSMFAVGEALPYPCYR